MIPSSFLCSKGPCGNKKYTHKISGQTKRSEPHNSSSLSFFLSYCPFLLHLSFLQLFFPSYFPLLHFFLPSIFLLYPSRSTFLLSVLYSLLPFFPDLNLKTRKSTKLLFSLFPHSQVQELYEPISRHWCPPPVNLLIVPGSWHSWWELL